MSDYADKFRSPFGQVQANPTTQVVPSSWRMQQQVDRAMAACEASEEYARTFAVERAETQRQLDALVAAREERERREDRFEAAMRHNRRVIDRGIRGALEHGCHPKPRNGGIDKFRF